MSEKKRKRADQPPGNKKKKVAIEEPTTSSGPRTIKVSSLLRSNLSPPVIATTPGVSLPSSVQFDAYSKLQNSRGKDRNTSPILKDLLLHSSAHKSLDYTGREDRPQGEDGLLRHYIGVFDPKSGALEVVETRKLVVRGAVRAQQASEESMQACSETQANLHLRTELGQAFGTKKAKKALLAKVENAIVSRKSAGAEGAGQPISAGEAALMDSIHEAAMNMPTREQLQSVIDGAKPIPNGNYDADEIEDVYDPKEIIGPDTLTAIPVRDWQEAIRDGEAVQVHSQYVANRVRRVGEHEESLKRLRILRYLYFLILFWIKAKPGRQGVRRVLPKEKLKLELPLAPDVVVESLRKKFTDHGEMRKIHVDLLISTCCVLVSIIDSFEVDTTDLREDLRLEQKQLSQYFHEIGARTKQVKTPGRNTTVAKLALPLVFPKTRQPKRR